MAEEKKEYLYGIDLGTTYSCISYMKDGAPVVCKSMEGEDTFPSVVRLLADEEPVVGRTAKDMAVIYPENTIAFIKSLIGRTDTYEYGPEGDKRTTSPVEVSAEILKKIKRDAEAYTNTEVEHVVITVPAYFGLPEREATKKAGELAGLIVEDIVEEPTAAAFYYGCQNGADETVCIFDLGGGTFDVTVMKIGPSSLEEITKDGDHDLGGKKWDAEMVDMVKEKFCEATGYDEEWDSETLQDLQIKCENAKKQLSSTNSTNIAISIDRAHRASIEVTREEFDARTSFLLDSAIDLTRDVLNKVNEKGIKVDKILLVGGSSYMPQVKEAIVREFGMEPEMNEPNEAVSKGACIYNVWKMLQPAKEGEVVNPENPDETKTVVDNGDGTKTITIDNGETKKVFQIDSGNTVPDEMIITRVASKSYGIRVRINGEPKIYNLVTKDTKLPYVNTQDGFSTSEANQTSLSLVLFQSEIEDEVYEVEDGVQVADAIVRGLPEGLPEGTPISISVELQENGFISVKGAYNGQELEGALEITVDVE